MAPVISASSQLFLQVKRNAVSFSPAEYNNTSRLNIDRDAYNSFQRAPCDRQANPTLTTADMGQMSPENGQLRHVEQTRS
jgi:hypothetical protein